MISRFIQVRKEERRTVLLLGTFGFLMLAATTMIATASDALFVSNLDAGDLPYGIALAQATAIGGFYIYRALKRFLRASWLNPSAVVLLVAGLAALYYFLLLDNPVAIYAFVAIVPLYQSVLGAEMGRLSASLIDARSARRLLPVLGAIGGLGASLGGLIVTLIAEYLTQVHVLPVVGITLLLLMLPAAAIKESMRPRAASSTATTRDVFKSRYALAMLLAAALIIALSTIVRTQFAAMADELYEGDDIGAFYGRFSMLLNITSVFFALFVSNWIMNRLGAARSLFLYPGIVGAIVFVGTQLPGMIATAAAQFFEKLVRQNIHNSASTIVNMPIAVGLRVRMALLASGVVKPLAVLLASAGLLATFGASAIIPEPLQWPDLYWPIGVISLLLFGLMFYVRKRYPGELSRALHARRLQLDFADDDGQHPLPLDPALRDILHSYLTSDLPERTGLALELLKGQQDPETVALVQRQWPQWEPWLKLKGIELLTDEADESAEAFLLEMQQTEPDQVSARLLEYFSERRSSDELWEILNTATGNQTRAAALATLASRADPRISSQMQAWLKEPLTEESAELTARGLANWPDDEFDDALPELLPKAPAAALSAISRRPAERYARDCITWLDRPETFPQARLALLALGEPAVPYLEAAAADPQAPNSSFRVLSEIEGTSAHLASMRLMAHSSQPVRSLATKARQQSPFALSAAELKLVHDNSEESIARAERFHHYQQHSEGLQKSVAASERDAALEDVFLNLALADPEAPYRQIYLATKTDNKRQRSFALELLEEHLTRQFRQRLLPILDEQPSRQKYVMDADREWLELQQRLNQKAANGPALAELKSTTLFNAWRVSELENIVRTTASDESAHIVLRHGQSVGLAHTLLTGESPAPEPDDLQVPLSLIYRVLSQAPRCGQLWLQSLVEQITRSQQASSDVTQSAMVSLASRTVGQDHANAGQLDIWQRMFFLRSSQFGQDLPAPRLRLLAEISKTLTAQAGEVVFHEGRLGNHFYLVCTGMLEVSVKNKVLDQLGPSEGFGALALMGGQRRPATVTAVQDSELIAISRVDFLDLIEAHPALVRSFGRSLAAQIVALSA